MSWLVTTESVSFNDEQSARTLGVPNVDGQEERFNANNEHARIKIHMPPNRSYKACLNNYPFQQQIGSVLEYRTAHLPQDNTPLRRISDPTSSKTWGAHTRKWWLWKYFVEQVA